MSGRTREHAVLANDAYVDRRASMGQEPVIDGVKYKILDTADSLSGYQGTAYQRADSKEIIIAHRGTESLADGMADAGMALRGHNNQLEDAILFTERAMARAKESEVALSHSVTISLTGHSLGGALAELTAAKLNLPAETFNAYGSADLKDLPNFGIDVSAKYPNIVNHVRATDVVAAAGHHLGELRTYAAPQDIENLRRGRYVDAPAPLDLPTNPLLTADLAAHKMSNFLPGNDVTGSSIMTPENEARARAYRGSIEQYRDDVVRNRIDLATIFNRAPSPLNMINPLDPSVKLRLQATDAAVVAAVEMTAVGFARTGRMAVQGAETIGNGASRAYDSVFGRKPAASPSSPQLDQPGHEDHAVFKQAQAWVHRLDAERGRKPDALSNQFAASLVVAARKTGIERIDGVWLSDDGARAFAVQGAPGSPDMKVANVSTVQAINTTIAQNTQALAESAHVKEPEQPLHQPPQSQQVTPAQRL